MPIHDCATKTARNQDCTSPRLRATEITGSSSATTRWSSNCDVTLLCRRFIGDALGMCLRCLVFGDVLAINRRCLGDALAHIYVVFPACFVASFSYLFIFPFYDFPPSGPSHLKLGLRNTLPLAILARVVCHPDEKVVARSCLSAAKIACNQDCAQSNLQYNEIPRHQTCGITFHSDALSSHAPYLYRHCDVILMYRKEIY